MHALASGSPRGYILTAMHAFALRHGSVCELTVLGSYTLHAWAYAIIKSMLHITAYEV
jgi:hypothetical protein